MGERIRADIRDCRELHVYQVARDAALRLYEISKGFPREERYSLTDQVRRSSRSVCANIAEAWQRRRDPAAFSSKLVDAAAEADETRCWLEFAVECGFADAQAGGDLEHAFDEVVAMLVSMANHPEQWRTR